MTATDLFSVENITVVGLLAVAVVTIWRLLLAANKRERAIWKERLEIAQKIIADREDQLGEELKTARADIAEIKEILKK